MDISRKFWGEKMKEQTWVIGSLNPNTESKTDLQANNAWNPLEVLKAGDLDGMLKKDSEQLKIVSDEISNFITATGTTLDPTDSTQLATAINKIRTSSLQFQGYVSTTEPSSSTYSIMTGNIWINSASMPTSFPVSASDIKVWNGLAWVNATSGYTPEEFHTFRNINDGEGYYWFGGAWKVMSTDMSTDYFTLNQTTGLWEIKTGVELTAPVLSASPSSGAIGHEIVDANWVQEHAVAKIVSIPVFYSCWFDHNPDNISWVNASNYSWLDGSMYQAAYQILINQYTPTGVFAEGSTYYVCQFSDGQIVTTTVLADSGTLQDLKDWCDAESYTYNAATTIEEFECYKTVSSSSETISGTTITYYQTFNGMKIIVGDTQIANAETIYNSTGTEWYYILDTVNERFKLPRTKWGFTGLRDTVGKYVPAGLPNITGTVGATCQGGNTSGAYNNTGAFVGMGNVSGWGAEENGTAHYSYSTFDASRSSTVYGNSTTVQPPATQMYLYFYVGNYTQTAIENTAGLDAELFNNKVDLSSSWGLPTSTYDDLTLGASGSTYTAPADGFFMAACTGDTGKAFFELVGNVSSTASFTGGWARASILVKRGETITIYYGGTNFTKQKFQFIYAQKSN